MSNEIIEQYLVLKNKLQENLAEKIRLEREFNTSQYKLLDLVDADKPEYLVYPLPNNTYAVFDFNWEDEEVRCVVVSGFKGGSDDSN